MKFSKRFSAAFIVLAALLSFSSPVSAQVAQLTARPQDQQGRPVDPLYVVNVNTDGTLAVGAGTTAQQVQGNTGAGGADSGFPVKVGGVFNTTLPTYTTGQRADLQTDNRGNLLTSQCLSNVCASVASGPAVDAISPGNTSSVRGFNILFNGTNWDRLRSIQDPATSGVGVTAVAIAPQSAAGGAIVPVATSAVASNLAVKASAGNLYSWRVTAGASAGYVMLFNFTSAPVDGAVTPVDCVAVPANGTVGSSIDMPERFSTGIVIVFSTTGCFTKTASATAYIRAVAQ